MNPLVFAGRQARALLVLEDGTCFPGYSCGASGEAFGEIVFNTSMVGYQEIVTDPSYAGQIVTLTYPDKLFQPTVFKATLANSRSDVTKIVADAIKQGGKSRRKAAEQSKEDHAWFEDTDTHVKMVAEGIVGTDKDGNQDWARLSELTVDGNGITSQVSVIKENQETMASQIKQTENSINLMVKKGELISEINMEPGNIRIKAAKINIDGVIQNLKAVEANVTSLQTVVSKSGAVNASYISTERMSFQSISSGRFTSFRASKVYHRAIRSVNGESVGSPS
jgi:hypothetical protein